MDNKHRFGIQAAATLLQNANFKGFFQGGLYSGPIKQVCVPGLNCYSCPGAVGACPIGSLQSFLDARTFRFPYYVVGLLIFFGALLGRAVCGFLCPFGWIQELIGVIPVKKRNRFRLDPSLRWVKYGVLAVLVIGLPLGLKLVPYFCKYLCPSGTLAGWLLALRDSILRSQLGALFTWKSAVLIAVIALSLRHFGRLDAGGQRFYAALSAGSAVYLEERRSDRRDHGQSVYLETVLQISLSARGDLRTV